MSATITVKLTNPTTGDLYELPFTSIRCTEELNGGGDISIDFNYLAASQTAQAYGTTALYMITSSFRELAVEMNGTKIWYGVVSDFRMSKDVQGNYTATLYGVGFFSLLQKRRTSNSRVFSAVDAGTIAWTLIDESQDLDPPYSDLGITQGSIDTSVPRDIEYNFAEVRQAIIDLSNARVKNGFDFDIDNTKNFNVYYPYKGTTRDNIVLDDGNLLGWAAVKNSVTTLTNDVYVVGQGFNSNVAYVRVTAATDYRSAFKLLQDVVSNKSESNMTNLTDQGNQYLAFNQAPIMALTVRHHGEMPDLTTYDLGDTLLVTIPELELNKTGFRVKKRQIEIDQNSNILVDLDLQTI